MHCQFTPEEKKFLLKIARESALARLEGETPVDYRLNELPPALLEKAGCFVTFKNKGELRGCLGIFSAEDPVWICVQNRAMATATEDTRFANNPVTAEELRNEIDLDISILSPPFKIQDPLKEVKIGRHGVIVSKGNKGGTYLPQVATENNWDLEFFLRHLAKHKAGISGDALNDQEVQWEAYEVSLIKEEK